MKKYLLFFVFFVTTCFLHADIFEIKSIEEMKGYLTDDSLVIFDLDNTIFELPYQIGSDQWFDGHIKYLLSQGDSKKEAFEKTYEKWFKLQAVFKYTLVENITKEVFDFVKSSYDCMALTTRGYAMAFPVKLNLKDLGIDFKSKKISKKEIFFKNGKGVLFTDGILLTNGTHKGKALFKLLKKTKYKPNRIVFINDKATHLKQIEEIAEKKNVPYVGLRYGFTDNRVKNITNEEIAIDEIEFSYIIK